MPTQTEYIYDQTENSWSVVTSGDSTPVTIGKITAGDYITLDPPEGDLTVGDVEVSGVEPGTPPENFWQRVGGVISPKTAGDDLALADLSGSAFLFERFKTLMRFNYAFTRYRCNSCK